MSRTAYVSIGNSDDKLTQKEWARFCQETTDAIGAAETTIYGIWFSASDSEYQNMCIGFAEPENEQDVADLKEELLDIASIYLQDSIAYVSGETEMLKP